MALSEREQQVLEGLERELHQSDPRFAERLQRQSEWFDRRGRVLLACAVLVGGLALLLAFCLTTVVALGVAGFLLVFVALDRSWAEMRSTVVAAVKVRWSTKTAPPRQP